MSKTFGRGLIINAAAAALIDHHLRSRGQNISLLAQTIRHAIEINARRFADDDNRFSFTNDIHVSSRTTDIPQVSFRLEDGKALHMPPVICRVKEDEDKDIVLTFREMMITPEVIYNAIPGAVRIVTTRRLPETLVTAAQGRLLEEVLSHPALDGRGLRIAAIANMPEGNTFNLRGTPPYGTAITLSPAGKTIIPLDRVSS